MRGNHASKRSGRKIGMSMLSPYIRHRLISEREVVGAVLDWNATARPLATKGFFSFKKHVPDLIERAGLK